jgi:hypothetical protein
MQRIPLTLALLVLPTTLFAQSLSDDERTAHLESLNYTHERITQLARTLTPEQWSFKPAEDRWSIAEVAEHILISEQGLKEIIMGPLMNSPRAEEAAAENRGEMIMTFMRDRSQKFQAPEQARPTGRWPSQETFLAAWKAERSATLEWVKTTDADLHGHQFNNPAFGPADGHEWLAFLAGHAERHVLQMEEVMVDPKFPASSTY